MAFGSGIFTEAGMAYRHAEEDSDQQLFQEIVKLILGLSIVADSIKIFDPAAWGKCDGAQGGEACSCWGGQKAFHPPAISREVLTY